MTDVPGEARAVPVWSPGDGPIRTRTWTRGEPALEVHTAGQWCPARLAQREDRQDGTVIYHVDITLPEASSGTRRSYQYDPATIRPVAEPTAEPIETHWDASGRVTRTTRPGE